MKLTWSRFRGQTILWEGEVRDTNAGLNPAAHGKPQKALMKITGRGWPAPCSTCSNFAPPGVGTGFKKKLKGTQWSSIVREASATYCDNQYILASTNS
jgi:hypothetical protein